MLSPEARADRLKRKLFAGWSSSSRSCSVNKGSDSLCSVALSRRDDDFRRRQNAPIDGQRRTARHQIAKSDIFENAAARTIWPRLIFQPGTGLIHIVGFKG